jgi:hypothetical protein
MASRDFAEVEPEPPADQFELYAHMGYGAGYVRDNEVTGTTAFSLVSGKPANTTEPPEEPESPVTLRLVPPVPVARRATMHRGQARSGTAFGLEVARNSLALLNDDPAPPDLTREFVALRRLEQMLQAIMRRRR